MTIDRRPIGQNHRMGKKGKQRERREIPAAAPLTAWKRRDIVYASSVAFILIAGFFVLFLQLRGDENRAIGRSLSERASSVNDAIISSVLGQVESMSRMAGHWAQHAEAGEEEWKQHARDYQRQYKFYRALAWVEPDLNVRWQTLLGDVHETEGRPLNLSEESRKEVDTALSIGRFVITKPFWLPDGKPGISFHFPMRNDSGVVGLLSGTMDVRQTIEFIIGPEKQRDYVLSAYAGDTLLYPERSVLESTGSHWQESFIINLDDDASGLRFELTLTASAEAQLRSAMPLIVLLFGIAVSLGIGTITLLGQRSRRQAEIVNVANREMQMEILERELAEQELQHLATHDPLTGLSNRTGFQIELESGIAQANGAEHSLCLMFVDLDRFKDINDSLGHEVGDLLLQAVPDRLREVFEEHDLIGRYGGDEFIVAVAGREAKSEVIELAERTVRAFDEAFKLLDNHVYVSASVGLAFCPPKSTNIAALIRNSDSALNKAKKGGRNRYAVFNEDILAESSERLALGQDIRIALENEVFRTVYQPIVRLRDFCIVGVEVLLRWSHEGNEIQPERFIPIAEETGSIVPLGRFVIERSLQHMMELRKVTERDLWVAINVSAAQFRDSSFPEFLSVQMHRNRIAPGSVHLELTEKVLIENIEENRKVLMELNGLGLRISVDDFGTGYSSLAYLKNFPVHCLKVDRSFIRDLGHSKDDRAIARTICALASNLGVETISEGVDQHAQIALLRDYGCDLAQGYLFSKPLGYDDLVRLLRHSTRLDPGDSQDNVSPLKPGKEKQGGE